MYSGCKFQESQEIGKRKRISHYTTKEKEVNQPEETIPLVFPSSSSFSSSSSSSSDPEDCSCSSSDSEDCSCSSSDSEDCSSCSSDSEDCSCSSSDSEDCSSCNSDCEDCSETDSRSSDDTNSESSCSSAFTDLKKGNKAAVVEELLKIPVTTIHTTNVAETDNSSDSEDEQIIQAVAKTIPWEDLCNGLNIPPLNLSESDDSDTEDEQDNVTSQIEYYKREISSAIESRDGKVDRRKILISIQKLYMLDVTALHLASTLIGRIVNNLCSMEDIIADSAQRLLDKWQNISLEAFLKAKEEWERKITTEENPADVVDAATQNRSSALFSGTSRDQPYFQSGRKRSRTDDCVECDERSASFVLESQDKEGAVDNLKKPLLGKPKPPRQPRHPVKKRKVVPLVALRTDKCGEDSAPVLLQSQGKEGAKVENPKALVEKPKPPRQPRQPAKKKKKLAPLMARVMRQMKQGFRR